MKHLLFTVAATAALLSFSHAGLARWVENSPGNCSVGPPPVCVAGHWHWEPDIGVGQGESTAGVIFHTMRDDGKGFISNDLELRYQDIEGSNTSGMGATDFFMITFNVSDEMTLAPGFHGNFGTVSAEGEGESRLWVAGPDAILKYAIKRTKHFVAKLGALGSFSLNRATIKYEGDEKTMADWSLGAGPLLEVIYFTGKATLFASIASLFTHATSGDGEESSDGFSANYVLGAAFMASSHTAPFVSVSGAGVLDDGSSHTVAGGVAFDLRGRWTLDLGLRKTLGLEHYSDWRAFATIGRVF